MWDSDILNKRSLSPVMTLVFQICSLMRGGIAERGGVRVGHRIIEINGQSVVAMAHEKIVQTLSVSVGEVRPPPQPRTPVHTGGSSALFTTG